MKASVGLGGLSCITAARLGGLVRLGSFIEELSTELWILSHPALREAITRLRPLFLGEDAQDRA
ncbi:MAG: hypothetical protein EXR82_07225 [Gammaproteobacteria bacterium]|nr:hypothetical protein [Gammaproteobacteria bacterium]